MIEVVDILLKWCDSKSKKGAVMARHGKRLTEEQRQEIIALYQSGLHLPEIAEKFDIHPNSIPPLLRRYKIPRTLRPPTIVTDEEKVKYIIEQYTAGVSSEKLGKEMGISPLTVCKVLKRNDVKIRS